MSRAVKAGEVWSTFIFDGVDCADLGVYAISNSSTYTTNLEPTFSDKKTSVTAFDGQYYYGTQITGQKFTFNMFAENLSLQELNKLKAWLNPRHIGKLISSDQPYKFYYVKPTSVGNLANIPLTNIQSPEMSVLNTFVEGDLVYTGKFNITFETVGSAYGYGLAYYRDDLIYDAALKYGANYYYNSGLLYKDMSPAASWDINKNVLWQSIPLYNPGTADGKPIYHIEHEGAFPTGSKIEIRNNTLGTSTVIDIGDIEGNLTINILDQTIQDEMGMAYYGRFDGPNLSVSPCEDIIEIPETFAKDEGNYNFVEYVSLSVKGNRVKIDPRLLVVDNSLIGYYFCCHKNGGIKIENIDENTNELILEKNNNEDIPEGGIEYNYIEVYNVLPASGNKNDVCVVNGVWYLYNTKWEQTDLFSSKEEFQDIYGDPKPVYRLYGANIVKLDDIIINTGYQLGDVSVEGFKMSATLQPRYL
jgi:phage-related protein